MRFDDITLDELLASPEPKNLRIFVKIELLTETIRCHSGVGIRPFLGADWTGLGELASVGTFTEDGSANDNSIEIALVHDDSEIFRAAMAENPMGGEVEFYLVLLNDEGQVLGGTLLHAGEIVDYQLKRGTPFTLSLKVSDWFEVWDRPVKNAKITDASQQHLYPGDRIFDQVEKLALGIDPKEVPLR